MLKKGLAAGQLVTIMITLVAFVLIAGTVTRFVSSTEDKEAEVLCHNSVVFRSASTINAGNTDVTLAPLLCKTIDKKIHGDREEIKEQLARMMARCWWMYNEGRQDDSLDTADIGKVLGFDGDTNKCALCYTAMIDEDEIDGGPIPSKEMFRYLINNEHPKIKDKRYIDYIQSYGGPGRANVLESIYPKEAYGIAFMAKSKDDSEWGVVDTVAAGTLAALAAVGVVACIIAEPCGLAAGLATSAGTLAKGAGVVLATKTAVTAGVATGYLGGHAYTAAKAKYFYEEERGVSMVVLDHLEGINGGGCELVNDIAGD